MIQPVESLEITATNPGLVDKLSLPLSTRTRTLAGSMFSGTRRSGFPAFPSLARIKKSIARSWPRSTRGSPAWRDKEDLLASVPGVGAITARTLIAELPELGVLDCKQIASLAGLAPFTRQSGQWKGKAMISGGGKTVRSTLFLAALAACRHNPVLKAFRQRLNDAGKPKMLVAIAAARKLLAILNAILRDKQPWRAETA
jgi:transposase